MSKINLEDLKYIGSETNSKFELTADDSSEIVDEFTDDTVDSQDLSKNLVETKEVSNESENVTNETKEITDKSEEMTNESEELKVQSATIGSTVNVRKLAIYPIPSTTVPSRLFTGNVEILGRIEEFTIVKYVKSGFGPVKGYTLGL